MLSRVARPAQATLLAQCRGAIPIAKRSVTTDAASSHAENLPEVNLFDLRLRLMF